MPKNIVVCCDGTGNEIGVNMSNVLKLYRILKKNDNQVVYYDPGVGTLGQRKTWGRLSQSAKGILGLATGYGLDEDVLGAYRFLAENYIEGDRVFLFGFSRGAYSVRVLAGFIHLLGLLRPDQLNYVGYAFAAYKRAAIDGEDLSVAWHFRRIVGGRTAPIKFLGAWDTVASVIVPRPDRFYIPSLETLPYTLQNPSVEVFRHAIAIDEFRRMFRLHQWKTGQDFKPNRFSTSDPLKQDSRQVWFAGCHSDIGGGYPEHESGLSKYPLSWMIRQAMLHGLNVNTSMFNHLVEGKARSGSQHAYAKPCTSAELHVSTTGAWRALEALPKKVKWREWPTRKALIGFYLPRAEPRLIPENALIHSSVLQRMQHLPAYLPENLPKKYEVET
ncbi:hypothetical protein PhaeoP23_03727 (plasmid) [Phaeobacter piscinae]|uniref:T6SS Phospholipase effector Tle1-like catalytic domain-containing protein n=1 Tax=Phaeobacter piscinae TaxID=1580596 RepID=A0ABN5DK08_9RHOB|nr:DUF2235 domain-containing protein [Phaeobacter piscinae]ATG37804.1 hypothetical protein PhaeoP36_03727 [Phaeobacter piscinae]AUQ88325.1 hypothetical protein PhaeoP42_03728 [Phaeobacter piscinae]AUR26208.1 hypothetical protein PhaeoP23_03727 [Phaeobacter piscinae]